MRMQSEKQMYEKFIESFEIEDWEVDTDTGWKNIEGIGKTIQYKIWELKTESGKLLNCADNHILIKCDNIDFSKKSVDCSEILTKSLKEGDFIMTKNGPDKLISIIETDMSDHMYDLQVERGTNHLYYTSDILSHNSLWMQNFAINAANAGKNVIYFSLEMSEKKVMKRIGAMRLHIPINEYEETSKNKEFMQERLTKMRKSISSKSNVFEKKIGKIYVKEFAAGQATISDFDSYLTKWQEKFNEKVDLIIVDYITIMAPERGLNLESNLYMKGKHLAEGLRSLGFKYASPVLTAIQVSKDAWGAGDINLASVPESKAIPETCDSFWAIIRSPEMKRLNLYKLKALKLRDGNFEKDHVMFDLNPKYLTIENDRFSDTDTK